MRIWTLLTKETILERAGRVKHPLLFFGKAGSLCHCIINLLLLYSLCSTGPALGNHSTCPSATLIGSGSGHHSYQTNYHLLWEFSWENSSLFLEGDDWKESHESGDKEGSILLLHGEGLPENEAHIKVELRDEGKRINPHDIIRTLEYIFTWSHLSLNFSVKWTTELPFLSTLLKSSFYHLHLREIRIIQRKVQKQASIISTNINGF